MFSVLMLTACSEKTPTESSRCNYSQKWKVNPPPSNALILIVERNPGGLLLDSDQVSLSAFSNKIRQFAQMNPSPVFLVKISPEQPCAYQLETLNLVDSLVDCSRSSCATTPNFNNQLVN